MDDALGALQHQVNTLQNQSANWTSDDDCARLAGTAWSDDGGVEPCTRTDERDVCR